jgi:hypothetical protein
MTLATVIGVQFSGPSFCADDACAGMAGAGGASEVIFLDVWLRMAGLFETWDSGLDEIVAAFGLEIRDVLASGGFEFGLTAENLPPPKGPCFVVLSCSLLLGALDSDVNNPTASSFTSC